MSTRRALVACAVLLALTSPAVAQAPTDGVSIRVYDYASLGRTERDAALDAARAIVAETGVNSDWHDCDSRMSCDADARGLVVRIIREPGAAAVPADGRRALGYSVIDSTTSSGKLATIFINRVEFSARGAGADVSTLLGRAIAHEVGHLLLRSDEHGEAGLLRSVWTDRELSRNHPEDWRFAAPDRSKIKAAAR
jgi:hypothetical protein